MLNFKFEKLNIFICLGAMFVLMLLFVFYPRDDFSRAEGRQLQEMPALTARQFFSGQFARDFDGYFTDNFPFREEFLKISAGLESAKGLRPNNVKIHAPDVPPPVLTLPQEPNDTAAAAIGKSDIGMAGGSDNAAETPTAKNDGGTNETIESDDGEPNSDVGVTTNGVFVIGGRAMSLYGGNSDAALLYAGVLSSYPPLFPEGTIVYNGVIPTSVEFNLPERYKSLSPAQKPIIDLIYENLKGIKPVDIYSELNEHRKDYIYFGTDHHWTPEGAYWAYTAFCKAAELTPVPLSDLERLGGEQFVGSMHRYTGDPKILENPDTFYYYSPKTAHSETVNLRGQPYVAQSTMLFHAYAKGENMYSTILGGDFPLYTITTEAAGDRSIAVIKESFGNAVIPYLVNHYSKIYVIDQRYFELSLPQLVKDQNIGEVLFLNNAFAAVTKAHIDWIAGLK